MKKTRSDGGTVEQNGWDAAKIARLAMLEFDDEEIKTVAAQMERIVAFARTVAEADACGEEEADADETGNVWREDAPGKPFPRDELLAAAPSAADGFFTVPRVVEQGDRQCRNS